MRRPNTFFRRDPFLFPDEFTALHFPSWDLSRCVVFLKNVNTEHEKLVQSHVIVITDNNKKKKTNDTTYFILIMLHYVGLRVRKSYWCKLHVHEANMKKKSENKLHVLCLKVNPIGEWKTKARAHEGKFSAAYDIVPDTLPCTQFVIHVEFQYILHTQRLGASESVSVAAASTRHEYKNKWKTQSMTSIYVLFFRCGLIPHQSVIQTARKRRKHLKWRKNNSNLIIAKTACSGSSQSLKNSDIWEEIKRRFFSFINNSKGFRHCA